MSNFISSLSTLLELSKLFVHKKPDSTCAICLISVKNGDIVFPTDCGHDFHLRCLTEWNKISCSCPVCRQEIVFKK